MSTCEFEAAARRVSLVSASMAAVSSFVCSNAALAASFIGLGDLPGGSFYSSPGGLSADGSTVVGTSSSASGWEAFRWTGGGGMVALGDFPDGYGFSVGAAVSADGSIVAGYSDRSAGFEAFRWTSDGGMVGLGDLPGGRFETFAYGISSDGATIVGSGESASGTEAFVWTNAGGMVGLGDLPGGRGLSYALSVSGDGSTVIGYGTSAPSGFEAFRWTSTDGMIGLGFLSSWNEISNAYDVSADGSTIVGSSYSLFMGPNYTAGGTEAFRWTSGDGMVGLGVLPGGWFTSVATGVSADGSTIVGSSVTASPSDPFEGVYRAFVWDETNGLRRLDQVLVDLGLGSALAGWELTSASYISDDGFTILGYGTNPTGEYEPWLAIIPEPGTASLLGVGLIGLAARRRSSFRPA